VVRIHDPQQIKLKGRLKIKDYKTSMLKCFCPKCQKEVECKRESLSAQEVNSAGEVKSAERVMFRCKECGCECKCNCEDK